MEKDRSPSSCRICLEEGASLAIFEANDDNNCDTLLNLSLCLNEKIEDIDGYPRNICNTCNTNLETACNFINKYRDTSKILEGGLNLLKKENVLLSDISCNMQSEFEIEIANIKCEAVSDDNFIFGDTEYIQPELDRPKLKNEKTKNCVTIKKIGSTKSKKLTNKVASAILEGEFMWNGKIWCVNSKKISETKKNLQKNCPRQKPLNIKLAKVPKSKEKITTKLCDICGEVFKNQDRLSVHRKTHEDPVRCPKCPKLLASQYYLMIHLKRKHDGQRKFICSICGRGFVFEGELKTHIKKVHEKNPDDPKKKFACRICNKTYKCQKSVIIHERSAHTGQRPAVCSICDSCFYHEDYLKEHMRLHTGETPFKCPICGRGYAQSGNMKSHMRIHRRSELDEVTLSKLKPNYLKLLKA